MTTKIKYYARGDYGIEFVADSEKEVQDWVDEMARNDVTDIDYYQIGSMTEAELDALSED